MHWISFIMAAAKPPNQMDFTSPGSNAESPGPMEQLQSSPPLSRIGLNTNKAGMEGLDKTKIDQIIIQASKGSKYYENELQKERKVKEKIDTMLKELKQLSPSAIETSVAASDNDIEAIELRRDLSHIIVHVDMDAFYAAVEMRDDPSLLNVPMAVGGQSMLSTSNYLARRYGVRAAMPGFIAKKLCPQLVIVKSHFSKYQEVSQTVREILSNYDPLFSSVGLDEAYLDITEYVTELMRGKEEQVPVEGEDRVTQSFGDSSVENTESLKHSLVHQTDTKLIQIDPESSQETDTKLLQIDDPESHSTDMKLQYGSSESLNDTDLHQSDDLVCDSDQCLPNSYWECAERVVNKIRERIHLTTQLTASAGIASNKMLAKIASDMNKPNGQYMIPPSREKILEFIRKLPIRKVSGIGKVTEKMLNALGIVTGADIYDKRGLLRLMFSKCSYDYFMNICLGIGSCTVHSEWERKSISTERTFPDIWKPSELFQKCHKLCYSLTEEVEESNIKGKTVTLKLKTSAFEVKQRSMTFPNPISSFADIHKAARILLETEMKNNSQLKLRLMGVRLSSLEGTSKSPSKKRSNSAAATVSLDRFFSPEEKAESNTMESKRVKVSEEVQRNSEDGFETKMSEEVEGSLEDGFETSLIEMKTCLQCPVCNKDVPGDNAALNLHVDECLNQSAIEEMSVDPADVSICSSTGNKSFEMLQQPSIGKTTSKSATPLSRSKIKKSQRTGKQNPKGGSTKKGKAAVLTPVKSLKSFFV